MKICERVPSTTTLSICRNDLSLPFPLQVGIIIVGVYVLHDLDVPSKTTSIIGKADPFDYFVLIMKRNHAEHYSVLWK